MFRLLISSSIRRSALAPTTTFRAFHRAAPRVRTAPTLPARAQLSRRWASSTTLASSTTDPATVESLRALEEGTQKLEDGDLESANALYLRSIQVKRTPSALFNYGVTCYHLKDFTGAIDAWKESIELQPDSPDAHTNLASAYIMMPISRPDLAVKHLREAARLSPDDAEIAFNLGAVLEAAGHLEEALDQYKRSKEHGVEKAEMHARNVSAKILGKKLKEAAAAEAAAEQKQES